MSIFLARSSGTDYRIIIAQGADVSTRYAAEQLARYLKDGTYVYLLLDMEDEIRVTDVTIANIYRTETDTPVETIYLGKKVKIDKLSISKVTTENKTGAFMRCL